jgi:hypothetical protein
MVVSNVARAAAVAALLSLPLQTQAMEFVAGSGPAAHIGDDRVQTVQYRHGPHGHVNVNRNVNINRNVHVNGYRPGYHPGYRPGYHPGYRPGGVVVAPGGVWAGRPGWYRWAPGGAIAAGAAIGFVTAATAAAWAPAPPQPGLCWYYTDPSRTQGFWDACP